jgi:acyl carrier protein
VISEEKFLASAKEFLGERLGDRAASVDVDTELVRSGLLDSLLVLEFFFFLEGLTGTELDPEDATVESLSTLRNAYQLVAGLWA